mmetsp:Transcript_33761/g.84730  ORF Transcript_33761/g.84730 Transcript_33761/m.84730 type:complete len:162 (-) Transcript_33761:256-741(-)
MLHTCAAAAFRKGGAALFSENLRQQASRRWWCSQPPDKLSTRLKKWWEYWTSEPLPAERWSAAWLKDKAILCTVYSISGTSTALLVRPTVERLFDLEVSLWEAPWYYKVASVLMISPTYGAIALVVGTLAGRHAYFLRLSQRIVMRPVLLLRKAFFSKKSG